MTYRQDKKGHCKISDAFDDVLTDYYAVERNALAIDVDVDRLLSDIDRMAADLKKFRYAAWEVKTEGEKDNDR